MKTPYKKPSSEKSSHNQIRRPKWAPKQQEEDSVCDAIRRNIGDDSAEIRRHELSIGQLQERIRQNEDAIRGLERRRADLNAAEVEIPKIPGPDIPNRARGRLGTLIRLLQALGHASDALSLMDATSRALAVSEAQREIARRISNHEDEIERLRRLRDQIQDLLDERVAWMRQHFKAFADHKCSGNAFNSYRLTPSSQLRRQLT
jgi:hypothetical protein